MKPTIIASALVFSASLAGTPTIAQILPDITLPVNSIVLPNGNVFTIEGGTEARSNLFHSFQEFSLPTVSEAFFNNALSIDNIITRVTGDNLSDIDGLIRANGTANLFLLNPNGIVFGPNARLDIGGSFLGSTADSLLFEDGSVYSAIDPNASGGTGAPPLLTVSVPIGLQLNPNSGPIQVRGLGHTLRLVSGGSSPILVSGGNAPIDRGSTDVGLRVSEGNTLALVGGDVVLDGGTIAAEGGRVELGSVEEGVVRWHPSHRGGSLSYEGVQRFGDIQLVGRSLADASGVDGGSIQVQGQNLSLLDGSRLLIQNQGMSPAGGIDIQTSESVEISGEAPGEAFGTALLTETIGRGRGGDITISTRRLLALGGAGIFAKTFSPAEGGRIAIEASESVRFEPSIIDPMDNNSIRSDSFSSGNAGEIEVSTGQLTLGDAAIISRTLDTGSAGEVVISAQQLRLFDGGSISSTSFSSGNGGDVQVNVDSIEILGVNRERFSPSSISASTIDRGNAGNVTVNTERLVVRDGGRVDASTLASGEAGSVTINASELVEVTGNAEGFVNPSLVVSSANEIDETLQLLLGLPPLPSGNSGNVTVKTPRLRVTDGAQVTVRNDGMGDAGTLAVNANSIVLEDEGGITASTRSGRGGNIALKVRDLQLSNGSRIAAEAGGTGNGGNLTLDSNTIALLENSRINANALEGAGGNIQITTQGLFISPDSQITASSQFGLDGIITINNPDVDPASGLFTLPEETEDASQQVLAGCQWTAQSEFTITGRGGLRPQPDELIQSRRTWADLRDLSEFRGPVGSLPQTPQPQTPQPQIPMVEATGWIMNEDGQVELVAVSPETSHSRWHDGPHCPIGTHTTSQE